MALKNKSLFLYNIEVTLQNRAIDFQTSFGGPVFQATLPVGFYSLTSLMNAVRAAMQGVDLLNFYTVTADRTVNSGTENRVTIVTSGSYLSLLFGTGPRSSLTAAPLLGFTSTDKTGALTYTGTSSCGTPLTTEFTGYNYLPTTMNKHVDGAVSVSASGEKEAIVFQIQEFIDVEFRYEPEAKVITEWQPLTNWMIQQKLFDFTPDISFPNTVIECTLESSTGDSKGLGFKWREMLPDWPFNYSTGSMKFRKRILTGLF